MRSFNETCWKPDGPRPHVHIAPGPAVAELAAAYTGELRRWWDQHDAGRALPTVVEVLDSSVLHLTVAWVDRLTAEIGDAALAAMHQAIAARVAPIAPFTMQVGPAWVGTYAIELYVTPHPELGTLTAAVRAALRDVLGVAAAPESPTHRPWRPHITLAYTRQPFDSTTLASHLAYTRHPHTGHLLTPVTTPVTGLIQVNQDTYTPTGLCWDHPSVRTIDLLGAQRETHLDQPVTPATP